jgi:autotransporter passenger strand-loop-strand repeat protein
MTVTVVIPGQVASGSPVTSGNELLVSSGGETVSAQISAGGTEVVLSGALAVSTMVSSGGSEIISGVASGSIVKGGGSLALVSGATIGTTLSSGGTETVSSGATVSGGSVLAGGVLSGGGILLGTISDAGQVIGGTVSSGGSLVVKAGGTTSGITVTSGGTEILSGGTAVATVVQSGGTVVFAGGVASGLVLSGGATEVVASGITLAAPSVGSGVLLVVSGTDRAAVIGSGGRESIASGGTSIATTVASGGTETVLSGGLASGTVVSGGGTEVISSGGTLLYTNGGVISGTVLGAGTLDVTGGTLIVAGTAGLSSVAIGLGGGVLAIRQSETFGSFAYSGGTATIAAGDTLTIAGAATLNNAEIEGPGAFVTKGATTFDDLYLDDKLGWTNTGTVTDSGEVLVDYPSGSGSITVTNTTGAVFDLTTNGVIASYAQGTFVNAGLLEATSGTGTVEVFISNTGTMTATSGTLQLDGGGVLGGTIGATGAGTIAFVGGVFTLAGTTQTIAGNVEGNGGTISIAKGDTLTLTGASNLSDAFVDGPGTFVTTGATTLTDLYLDGGVAWTNTGTVTDAGQILLDYPSGSGSITVTNTAGAVFDITANGEIYPYAQGTFVNAGLLEATSSTGSSYIYATVTNTGTITASTGVLEFDNGGTFGGTVGATGSGTIAFGGGTATLATGKTDSFAGLLIDGATVNASDAIQVTGTFTETGGALTLASGKAFSAASFDQTGGSLTFGANTTLAGATANGTLLLDGTTLTLTGAATLDGTDMDGPGTLVTTGAATVTNVYLDEGAAWTNTGTVADASVLYLDYPSATGSVTVTNTAGAVFDITNDGEIYPYAQATFVNAGLLETTIGTGTGNVYATVTNTGTLIANTGTLELDGGGTLGGTLGATNGKGVVLLEQGTFTTTGTATIADDGTASGLVLGSGETWTDSGTLLDTGHLTLGNVTGGSLTTLAITAGHVLDLTAADSGIAARGSTSITNAGTIAKTAGTGDAIIAVPIANTGTIDAGAGTLTLSGAVSGTGNLRIEAGSELELAAAPITTQTVTFGGAGATLKLDKPASITKAMAGFGAGDRIDLAGVTATAAGTAGDVLTVTAGTTSYTFASNASLAADHAAFAPDGAGGTLVTLYAEAQAAPHTPEPVVFGAVHVGATITQALTITNAAAPGQYTEALDAGLSGATSGFSTAGTITGLAGGASNATALTITETAANAGTLTGSATLTLLSDGTGIDGFGTTPLASQAVTISGAVYALAAPILNTETINLGDARVGGTLGTATVTLSDGTAASPYQESLIYAASAPVTITNGSGTIAAGSTVTIGFSLSTASSIDENGTVGTIGLTSTGAGTSGLANTSLGADGLTLEGEVFAPAVAALAGTVVNFGIIHVGDTTDAVQSLGVTNDGAGSLVDLLTAGTATTTGAVSSVSYAGLGTGLAAGSSGSVSIGINTATAGTISGSAVLGFTSHDSALADLGIAGGTVAVTGQINNYAVAEVEQTGGTGTLTGSGSIYTLNLGSIAQGSGTITADLAVLNAAVGPADLLGGSFTVTGSSAYTNTGLTPFSGLGAGQSEQGQAQAVTLAAATAGVFTETITLTPTDSNADFSETLSPETITVTGTVVSSGSIYTLTAAPTTITGTTGNDTIIAGSNTLNSHDVINGAGGVNTLSLIGGGYFDLGAPSTLANIQDVTAQESAAGTTVYMRNALDVTLTVAAGGSGSILIYGATDTDVYNLGAGSDTVVLGAATEAVNAGGGTALVQGTAAFAHALINGGTVGSPGTTTLELTTGGTATLNSGDTNLIVKLDAATNLGLGTASFITAEGAAKGGDTLTAGAANQTLESLGGKDTLVGFTGFGDTFLGTAAGFTGDIIKNFGGSDGIDFSDLLFATLKPLAYAGNTTAGKLTVTDGTHSGSVTLDGSYTTASFTPISDGHGGTLIQFV